MKRRMVVALMMAAALTLFAGCGTDKVDTPDTNAADGMPADTNNGATGNPATGDVVDGAANDTVNDLPNTKDSMESNTGITEDGVVPNTAVTDPATVMPK